MKIKTIDITAYEWFDKKAGNSYFSARVTINYGYDSEIVTFLPYQYGYGEHYVDMAFRLLIDKRLITDAEKNEPFWRYCDRKKITLRRTKYANQTKKDMIEFGNG